ncbi:hypothetical protein PI125_g1285 [Phytophthora idaei]|nr:hypothetical protein PI125_g1285 [Phytophthora idaei]
MSTFEHVAYKCFVKGHTKNSCDRGFGHIRKHMATTDCWTGDQVVDAVKAAPSSSETVYISRGSDIFRKYKTVLNELYKKLEGIQQFQVFTMDHLTPGFVHCRKGPHDEPQAKALRRKIDGVLTSKTKVTAMMSDYTEVLPPSCLKAEKIHQDALHHSPVSTRRV